jgi:hypothetical protein
MCGVASIPYLLPDSIMERFKIAYPLRVRNLELVLARQTIPQYRNPEQGFCYAWRQ